MCVCVCSSGLIRPGPSWDASTSRHGNGRLFLMVCANCLWHQNQQQGGAATSPLWRLLQLLLLLCNNQNSV